MPVVRQVMVALTMLMMYHTTCVGAWSNGSQPTAVLLGLTGVGKSNTGNMLCARNDFIEGDDAGSVTTDSENCQGISPPGKAWTIIDTPGFFDTGRTYEDVLAALARFTTLSPRGVDCFLLMVPCPVGAGRRFTDENHRVFQVVEQLFQRRVFNHSLLVFNDCGTKSTEQIRDKLGDDSNTPANLKNWMKVTGGRMLAIGDKDDDARRAADRHALYVAMESIVVDNLERPYDNSLFKSAREAEDRNRKEAAKMDTEYQNLFKQLEGERDSGRKTTAEFQKAFDELKHKEQAAKKSQHKKDQLAAQNKILKRMQGKHRTEIAQLQERMQQLQKSGMNEKEQFERLLAEARAMSENKRQHSAGTGQHNAGTGQHNAGTSGAKTESKGQDNTGDSSLEFQLGAGLMAVGRTLLAAAPLLIPLLR